MTCCCSSLPPHIYNSIINTQVPSRKRNSGYFPTGTPPPSAVICTLLFSPAIPPHISRACFVCSLRFFALPHSLINYSQSLNN